MVLAFHKPCGVICAFRPDGSRNRTLAEFGFPPGVYAVGRLDADSEGLLVLSDEPGFNERLLHPTRGHEREYWVQVEREPSDDSIQALAGGVVIQEQRSLPCQVSRIAPDLEERVPPVRFRKNVPTAWLSLILREGRNRQVRRMTASVGHPTLRLLRVRIGGFHLAGLDAGKWRQLNREETASLFVVGLA